MARGSKQTPMMAQYHRMKREIPEDSLLLFRLGDFYEMFFDDAIEGSKILNISLTKRGSTPMCGIPFHAAPSYITRMLKAGKKVALCEQLEEATPGKIVERGISQILSPGTHFDDRLLQAERNNYLAAATTKNGRYGIAYVDLTTGDFKAAEFADTARFLGELERLRPAEVIHAAAADKLAQDLDTIPAMTSSYEDWVFDEENARFCVTDHFKVASLDGFGLKNRGLATGAAGAILHYLGQHLRRDLAHLTKLSFYENADYLALDAITLRNLEILEPLQPDAPRAASLYKATNRTVTPMGARRLRDWLTQPLADVDSIRRRQDAVACWAHQPQLADGFRGALADVRDLERTLGRLSSGSGNARDLAALRTALRRLPVIKERLAESIAAESKAQSDLAGDGAAASLLDELANEMSCEPDLADLLSRAIVDEPPATLREGGIVREGFDAPLDELHAAARDGKDWIAKLQLREIERTRIPSLKVRYNSVFGYFIEITRSNLDKVPDDYVRKQTIANGERFITPELKDIEGKILGAEERSGKLEYELFQRVREETLQRMPAIQQTARALAQADVLAGFADTARLFNYCRPIVADEGVLDIVEGRHPALDQVLRDEVFVPNDTSLNNTNLQIALITGPNMAGKSTFIRQTALLALLAHTGSFIPAEKARIDLVDRVFTRIGASDDLARGQSTFMVEMSETANILNNATERSLVILDEIGRGTSTFDGLSLAWSIVEHLHNAIGAKTLFATHYHELTELAARLKRVANFNVAVREWNDEIVFLRKILPGGTDKSYGVQVARIAGVPTPVIDRAKEILNNLEEHELTPVGGARKKSRKQTDRDLLKTLPPTPQLDLFGAAANDAAT
jgi:DNA mismatch repair protein MutS